MICTWPVLTSGLRAAVSVARVPRPKMRAVLAKVRVALPTIRVEPQPTRASAASSGRIEALRRRMWVFTRGQEVDPARSEAQQIHVSKMAFPKMNKSSTFNKNEKRFLLTFRSSGYRPRLEGRRSLVGRGAGSGDRLAIAEIRIRSVTFSIRDTYVTNIRVDSRGVRVSDDTRLLGARDSRKQHALTDCRRNGQRSVITHTRHTCAGSPARIALGGPV